MNLLPSGCKKPSSARSTTRTLNPYLNALVARAMDNLKAIVHDREAYMKK